MALLIHLDAEHSALEVISQPRLKLVSEIRHR